MKETMSPQKKRFLFVVPPLTGHINPTVAVGQALMDLGHEVAWAGGAAQLRALLPQAFRIIALDDARVRAAAPDWFERAQSAFGLDSFRFFFEEFMMPLGHYMAPEVERAFEEYKPDLVIADQQALAGSVLARKHGIAWVTSATTSAAVINPLEMFPKVKEWMTEQYRKFQEVYGVPIWERPDLSELGVFVFSARELLPPENKFPAHFHFVGPSILKSELGVRQSDFDWEGLRPDLKKIYVTLGTLNAERSLKFYSKLKEAFGAATNPGVQVIVSAPPEVFGDVPANFIVQKSVPQLELLKRVDAVVFHGGHNTFCESLSVGLPLVVAPIKDDQPVIAEQVVRTGAGLRLHFDRVKPAEMFQAVDRVLREPKFKASAEKLCAALQRCGGPGFVAKECVRLVGPES